MHNDTKNGLTLSSVFLILFILLIVLLKTVDVAVIGPEDTSVGLSHINSAVHELTGVSYVWYDITKVLGILALAIVGLFAVLGLIQLTTGRCRSFNHSATVPDRSGAAVAGKGWTGMIPGFLSKVDTRLIALGCLYVVTAAVFVLFEIVVINYRPVIVPGDEHVEASFPSTHTMLAVVILISTYKILGDYIRNEQLCRVLKVVCIVMTVVIVVGRVLSGVHWFTDILGGLLIGAALLSVFYMLCDTAEG